MRGMWGLLALAAAGCTGGEATPETRDAGAADAGRVPETEPTGTSAPPPAKAPACSVASDTVVGSGEAGTPSITFGGGRFAAAWTEEGGLRATLADPRGTPDRARILPAGPGAKDASITALGGGGYLVVWQEPGAVRGLRLGADLTPAGDAFTLAQTSAAGARPVAAASGNDAVVAWTDAGGITTADVSGNALGARSVVPGASAPMLARGAGGSSLLFQSGGKLGLARMARPVQPLAPAFFHDGGKPSTPRAAATGAGFFVTWEDDSAGQEHEAVVLTQVSADGKPGPEIPVPGDSGSANDPDVAALGGYAAVVYYQFREGPSAVYLSLFGPDLRRAGDDLRISGKHARYPRLAPCNGGRGCSRPPPSRSCSSQPSP